jgi:putative transcription factor
MVAECEMCGKKIQKSNKIRIDGAILEVCDDCKKFGIPIEPKKPVVVQQPSKERVFIPTKREIQHVVRAAPRKPPVKKDDIENLYLVEGFPEIIKEAREKLSWTQDDLAKKIMEKKNVLSNIERGTMSPDIKTARKLEKLLDIKLLEEL